MMVSINEMHHRVIFLSAIGVIALGHPLLFGVTVPALAGLSSFIGTAFIWRRISGQLG